MSNIEFVLAHSGIKGMKWGINRYRNPDGTLTPEGKERYRYNKDSSQNAAKAGGEIQKSLKSAKESFPDSKNRPKPIRKDYSKIPNDELERRIKRLELEHRYGDLTGETKYVKSGSEKVKDILGVIGSVAAIGVSALMIRSLMYDNAMKKSNMQENINKLNEKDKTKK